MSAGIWADVVSVISETESDWCPDGDTRIAVGCDTRGCCVGVVDTTVRGKISCAVWKLSSSESLESSRAYRVVVFVCAGVTTVGLLLGVILVGEVLFSLEAMRVGSRGASVSVGVAVG